jgi:hypothetical protein
MKDAFGVAKHILSLWERAGVRVTGKLNCINTA